jgi:hypothetical protein
MRKALTNLALILLSAGLAACGASGVGEAEVVYTIESDAPTVLATYATANSSGVGQEQDTAAAVPWSKTITAEASLARSFVLSGAMNPVLDGSGPDGTTITCRITVNGEVVSEQTSTGQYASATCSST